MTTASDIITQAYREGNLIAVGTTPTSAEQTEALSRLNRFVRSLVGFDMGEGLSDWLVPAPQRVASVAANYPQLPFPTDSNGDIWPAPLAADLTSQIYLYPPQNSRLVYDGSADYTVYFPEAPDDGARMGLVSGSGEASGLSGHTITLDGNGRTIETTNTQAYVDPVTARQWFYRADKGDWVVLADMLIGDTFIFPEDFEDLFIIGLAKRLAPPHTKALSPESEADYKRLMTAFKARYRQHGTSVFGSQDIPASMQSYAAGRWYWGG